MKTLPIDLTTFGFVTREKDACGRTVMNRCGRDFLYYVFHYHLPAIFAPLNLNPERIEKERVFGFPLPAFLIWTCLPFFKIPGLMRRMRLSLSINGAEITNFLKFLVAMLGTHSVTADDGFKLIEQAIDKGSAAGIDISLGMGGLLDHVMFVYGYDTDSFYVFDTHIVPGLEYIKTTDDKRFIMKLPKLIARQRWTRFNRAWTIERIID